MLYCITWNSLHVRAQSTSENLWIQRFQWKCSDVDVMLPLRLRLRKAAWRKIREHHILPLQLTIFKGFCVALAIQGGSRERCYVDWLHMLGVWPKANNQTTNFTDFYKTGLCKKYHGRSHPSHLSIEWITWCGRFHSWMLHILRKHSRFDGNFELKRHAKNNMLLSQPRCLVVWRKGCRNHQNSWTIYAV